MALERALEGGGPAAGGETEAEFLSRYDPRAFPCFAVTVDAVVVTIHQGRLSVLLVERREHPYRGAWALPGSFVGLDEELDSAAWRTLSREAGLTRLPEGIHLEQLGTYGTPGRDPRTRVVSVAYLALTPDTLLPGLPAGGGRARFWPAEDVAGVHGDDAPHLAFDHAAIVRDGVERVRAKLEYTTVALSFVEEPLTLADLRHVYETVWGVPLDPSNFRRKVLDTAGFVVPLDGERRRSPSAGRGRPGELYTRGTALWLDRVIARPRRDEPSSDRRDVLPSEAGHGAAVEQAGGGKDDE